MREAEKQVSVPQRDTILIVDDDLDVREALADTLEDLGYDVLLAINGADALKLLRQERELPSAILLDLTMPVMDGYAFLEEQRRDVRLAEIPVAVVTAGSTVDRARLGTPVPVVRKPIKLPVLESTLREFHERGRNRDAGK